MLYQDEKLCSILFIISFFKWINFIRILLEFDFCVGVLNQKFNLQVDVLINILKTNGAVV